MDDSAGLTCGSCSAGLGPTAKFCSECGAPVAPVSQAAEYKQVTVLFADVVHSMDIASAVGPERLREIMAELVGRAAAVIQRYGGDDAALRDLEETVQLADRGSDDFMLSNARHALGSALLHRGAADRERGLALLEQVRATCEQGRYMLSEIPILDAYIGREKARRGDVDAGLQVMRSSADELFNRGQFGWFPAASSVLAETFLERGYASDIDEAEAVTDRLAAFPTDDGFSVVRDIMALRLRTLIAQARGDEKTYRDLRDRYRATANSLGFEGHMAWAEAMA